MRRAVDQRSDPCRWKNYENLPFRSYVFASLPALSFQIGKRKTCSPLFHNSVNSRDYVRVFLLRLNSSSIRDLDSLRLILCIPLVLHYRRIIYRNAFCDRCSIVSLVALFPRFSSTHSLLAIRNKTASRPTLAFSLQRSTRLKSTPSRKKKVLGRSSQFRLRFVRRSAHCTRI